MRVAAVKLPDGRTFELQDLPLDVLDRIAKKHALSWAAIMDNPVYLSAVAAVDVVREVCAREGVDPPTMNTGRELVAVIDEWFTTVEDDLPEPPEAETNAVPTGSETATTG